MGGHSRRTSVTFFLEIFHKHSLYYARLSHLITDLQFFSDIKLCRKINTPFFIVPPLDLPIPTIRLF